MSQIEISTMHEIGNEGLAGVGVANEGSARDDMVALLHRYVLTGRESFAMIDELRNGWKCGLGVAGLQSSSKPDFGIFDNIMLMLNEFWDRRRDSGNGGSAGEFKGFQKSMNELMLWLDEIQDLYRDIFNGIYDAWSAVGRIVLGERVNEFMRWLDLNQNLFREIFSGIDYEGTTVDCMELLFQLKQRLNRISTVINFCNIIHNVGFTRHGINNGGYTEAGIANGFAGAGGYGGPPGGFQFPMADIGIRGDGEFDVSRGGFQYPMDVAGIAGDSGSGGPAGGFQYPFVGILCDIGNGALAGGGIVNGISAGGGIANGSAGVGGLGGSPGEYGSGGGGPQVGGGGESPSGGGGPGGAPGEGVGGGGGSYGRVRTTVIVDESEIVCIVKARGRAKRRIVRTSVKARPGKIRHAVRFKRVDSLQGQAEM